MRYVHGVALAVSLVSGVVPADEPRHSLEVPTHILQLRKVGGSVGRFRLVVLCQRHCLRLTVLTIDILAVGAAEAGEADVDSVGEWRAEVQQPSVAGVHLRGCHRLPAWRVGGVEIIVPGRALLSVVGLTCRDRILRLRNITDIVGRCCQRVGVVVGERQ